MRGNFRKPSITVDEQAELQAAKRKLANLQREARLAERPRKAGRIQHENPKPGWMRANSPYEWFGQRHAVHAKMVSSKHSGRVNVKYELDRLKGQQGCLVCGIRYPEVLHFHHRNPDEKLFNLSNPPRTITWEEIQAETRKCDVVCGNCHALIHSGRIYRIESELTTH